MSLSRKRKKELRRLQDSANKLWESQQDLLGDAAGVAREASRQLGNYGREQVRPAVQHTYEQYGAPVVAKGKDVLTTRVVPAAGAIVGSALSVWDAANDTRARIAAGRGLDGIDLSQYAKKADKHGKNATLNIQRRLHLIEEPKKKGLGAGGVIAIILGAAAAIGVLYAAWQTLRADDELWVADDPLAAPEA